MRAAVLDQADRACLAAPQCEEFAQDLHPHRPPGLEFLTEMDGMPESPEIAAGQSAGSGVSEILARLRVAHLVVPAGSLAQGGRFHRAALHKNTTSRRIGKASE